MSSDIQKLRRAANRWWVRSERARWLYATLGRVNSDGTVTVAAPRQNYVWITMDTGTLTQAYNKGNGAVPLRAGLPVKVRDDAGRLIIDGENTSGLLEGDDNAPGSVYSVNDVLPDSHGNVTLDSDDIDEGATNQYYTAERARDDIGAALVAGTGITVTPSDPGDTITIATTVAAYTDEQAQDAVGNILVDSTTIDFTYADATPSITAVRAALTGDVTAPANSNATTIANDAVTTAKIINDAVTFAKMQNIATDSLIGRDTAGTGDAENILLNATLSMDGSGNLQRAALTGDVTASAGSNATTIANNAVTNAKSAQAVANTMRSNITGSTANVADNDIATVLAQYIHAATGKTTPVDADELALIDSAASNVLKKLTWANLKATIKSYYDSVVSTLTNKTLDSTNIGSLTGKTTPVDADSVVIVDSAASNVFKAVTGTNLKAYLVTYFSTLYAVLLGTAGGQTLNGGTAANDDMVIRGTAHATKATSYVALADDGGFVIVGAAASSGTGDTELDVVPNGVAVPLRLRAGTGGSAYIQFTPANASAEWGFLSALVGSLSITHNTGPVVFQAAATEALRLLSGGKASVGGLSSIGANTLGGKAGSSTNDFAVGGTLYFDSATHGNTTTGVTDLATYTVPADTLNVNNQALEFHAWGTTAANGNNKKVDVLFGSDSFTIFNTATSNAGSWSVRGKIVRTGAATQVVIIETQVSLIVATAVIASTATRTLSGSNVLKLQGTATSTNDIVQRGFDVKWQDSNV